MATYATQSQITPEQLAQSDDPDELIKATEDIVRRTLEGAPAEPLIEGGPAHPEPDRGETAIGWLARIPGTGPGLPPGTQHPTQWRPWDPAHDDVPDDADLLTCRGRRVV
jgi:hypothetical protein